MSSVKVVDASAIAALLFGEPEASAIAARIEGAHLFAPQLLAFEIANVCWVKCRRHPDKQQALRRQYLSLDRLGIEAVAVDHSAVVDLALREDLTAYDASYLWTTRQLNAELVTLDKALIRAVTPS